MAKRPLFFILTVSFMMGVSEESFCSEKKSRNLVVEATTIGTAFAGSAGLVSIVGTQATTATCMEIVSYSASYMAATTFQGSALAGVATSLAATTGSAAETTGLYSVATAVGAPVLALGGLYFLYNAVTKKNN